jgi:hypothetical protein
VELGERPCLGMGTAPHPYSEGVRLCASQSPPCHGQCCPLEMVLGGPGARESSPPSGKKMEQVVLLLGLAPLTGKSQDVREEGCPQHLLL